MNKSLLFFAAFILSSFAWAQRSVIGTVLNDAGNPVPDVFVINMRTDVITNTDQFGQFIITAEFSDELRFVKRGYERTAIKVAEQNFSANTTVKLQLAEHEIPEVALQWRPTGNLKRDIRALDQSPAIVRLNSELALSMRSRPAEVLPQNRIPSAFAPRNLSQGQVSLLSSDGGGLLGLLASAIAKKKNPVRPLTYSETERFYRQVKLQVDLDYFYKYGLDEYGFENFLLYADRQHNLAKRYANNFKILEIESILKSALTEYLKTAKI